MTKAKGAVSTTAVIVNKRGLHARAAAKFVKVAETFSSDVVVAKDAMSVSGRSIMGLMMLAAGIGSTITIQGKGVDASKALKALSGLVERKFDEEN